MKILNLKKGLFATVALSAFAVGTASAQAANFTPANTSVENTFTLNYDVNGAGQPVITNDGVGGNVGPTTFLVDRLIDLTVTNTGGNTIVAPGQVNAVQTFTVTNDGNDDQAYTLDVLNTTISGTADEFNPANPATPAPAEITYQVNGAGPDITYDPANTATFPVLGPDDFITVSVQQDIPAGIVDADEGQIVLVADTLNDDATPLVLDTDNNNDLAAVENVLADDFGTTAAQNGGDDVNADGAHSALGTYVVAETEVDGVKTVDVFSEDGSNCSTPTATAATGVQYAIPGACVEYLITVTNSDEDRAATAINVQDILPAELEYQAAFVQPGGDFTGTPSVTAPATAGTDCAAGACVVGLTGVSLPAAPAGGTSEGVLVIRATIK